MKIRAAALFVSLLWAASVSFGQTPQAKNPLGSGPEVVAAGHTLYNRTCTACHGIDGGEGERAPALVGDRRFFRLSENSIFETIKGGIGGTAMPPFAGSLPHDDIWRIVVFIRAMRGSASETDVAGNVEHGKAVFDGKGGCLKCHMLNGKGGTMGPDLSNIGALVTLQHLRQSLTQEGPVPLGYRPIKVVTVKGETVEGIAKTKMDFLSSYSITTTSFTCLTQPNCARSRSLPALTFLPSLCLSPNWSRRNNQYPGALPCSIDAHF